MTTRSAIEWTDYTWNPVTGCTKVSQGCKNCYAERLWPKIAGAEAKRLGQWPNGLRAFTTVRTHPDRLDQPLRMRAPRRIFVNSMSDLFHEDVPDAFIDKVFAVMARARQHTFQVLTKRPERAVKWFKRLDAQSCYRTDRTIYFHEALKSAIGYHHPKRVTLNSLRWPLPNVWLGVSIEDQATADERTPLLLQTPAAARWISAEPLLGPINLSSFDVGDAIYYPLSGTIAVEGRGHASGPRLDWIVTGGESGPKARPSHPDWFRSLRDQCAAAGVPFLFKQWGEWTSPYHAGIDPELADGKPYVHVTPMCRIDHTNDSAPNYQLSRVGKKAAGRTLDGRIHDEYPA